MINHQHCRTRNAVNAIHFLGLEMLYVFVIVTSRSYEHHVT